MEHILTPACKAGATAWSELLLSAAPVWPGGGRGGDGAGGAGVLQRSTMKVGESYRKGFLACFCLHPHHLLPSPGVCVRAHTCWWIKEKFKAPGLPSVCWRVGKVAVARAVRRGHCWMRGRGPNGSSQNWCGECGASLGEACAGEAGVLCEEASAWCGG